jgi:serine/threonine-protein phosphatase 2A activator
VSFLKSAKAWIAAIPPVKQSQRFGNTAFRTWVQRLSQEAQPFHSALLPDGLLAAGAATELHTYLVESFGNSQRIDYGSGHELNFIAWLTALQRIGILNTSSDLLSIAFDIFTTYAIAQLSHDRVHLCGPFVDADGCDCACNCDCDYAAGIWR